MSDAQKPEEDNSSVSHLYSKVQAVSVEKIPKSTESQSIIINFYSSNYTPKLEKVVQTERATTSLEKKGSNIREIINRKKEASTSPISETELEDSDEEEFQVAGNKSVPSLFYEKRVDRSMEPRKLHIENKASKNGPNARGTCEFERRKLEAELKAAEEIARIKETVIEKRLALELASLQNTTDQQKTALPPPPPPQPDLRALEEVALRKQTLVETNLAQELESLDYQTRLPAPRPSPPPLPSGPSRQHSPSAGKINAFKTESSSSVLNPLRNISLIDRKFNADKGFPGHSELRNSSPTNFLAQNEPRYPEPRYRMDDRHPGYPRQEFAYNSSGMSTGKTHSIWRSALAKIKKKMRSSSKPPPEWRNYHQDMEKARGK